MIIRDREYKARRVLKSLVDTCFIDDKLGNIIRDLINEDNGAPIYYKDGRITNCKSLIKGNKEIDSDQEYFIIFIDYVGETVSCSTYLGDTQISCISQNGIHSLKRVVTEKKYYYDLNFPDEKNRGRVEIKTRNFDENGFLSYDSVINRYSNVNGEDINQEQISREFSDNVTIKESWYFINDSSSSFREIRNADRYLSIFNIITLIKTTELYGSKRQVNYGICENETSGIEDGKINYKSVDKILFDEFQLKHMGKAVEPMTSEKIKKLVLN